MAGKEGQFDVVELMVNDQFKTFSVERMLNMLMEWTHMIQP